MNKKIFLAAATAAVMSVALPGHGQDGTVQTQTQTKSQSQRQTELNVRGGCGMCKRRIETVVAGFAGVSSASWNLKEQKLTLALDVSQSTIDDIGKALAEIGYDNDIQKADDAVYNKLQGCCKYKR